MINKHQDWQEQIPFYIAQSLSAEQRRSFESHLATCDSCQAEIDEWRMIASAVWREADDIARQLPPLSQEVYNRLSYRDKPPVSRYAANPPRPQANNQPTQPSQKATPLPQNVTVLPKNRRIQLPITMVAGLVVAVVFGGLLLMFSLRENSGNGEVAIGLTANVDSTQELGAQSNPVDPSPTSGIIPTQAPTEEELEATTATNQFVTNTPEPEPTDTATAEPPSPEPFVPTQDHSFTMVATTEAPPPTLTPSPTNTQEPVAPLGGGPYITITPGLYSEGVPYCEIYNPTNALIETYIEPDANTEVTGALMPSQSVRVISMSEQGWYFIVLPSFESGWIAPRMAYLRGSCYAGYDIPFATPSDSAIPSPTFESDDTYEPSVGQIVVINAAYADLQAEPSFNSSIMGVVSRNEQFPVLGYQGLGTNRFVNVVLPDGRTAWIWAQIVIGYPADQAPASPTPQK